MNKNKDEMDFWKTFRKMFKPIPKDEPAYEFLLGEKHEDRNKKMSNRRKEGKQ